MALSAHCCLKVLAVSQYPVKTELTSGGNIAIFRFPLNWILSHLNFFTRMARQIIPAPASVGWAFILDGVGHCYQNPLWFLSGVSTWEITLIYLCAAELKCIYDITWCGAITITYCRYSHWVRTSISKKADWEIKPNLLLLQMYMDILPLFSSVCVPQLSTVGRFTSSNINVYKSDIYMWPSQCGLPV